MAGLIRDGADDSDKDEGQNDTSNRYGINRQKQQLDGQRRTNWKSSREKINPELESKSQFYDQDK